MADRADLVLLVAGLQSLVDVLREHGWTVVGPTVRDGAVVHDEITSVSQLPRGVGDRQDAGSYRLAERADEALFGYAVGPQAWKSLLFPARELLWSGRREGADVHVEPALVDATRLALLGVRSCDLHAIGIHDRVLGGRAVTDAAYVTRRAATFVIAVTCSDPGGTCFCASMGTGPAPDEGFDLALTELLDDSGHRFVVTAGSGAGADVLAELLSRAPDGQVRPAVAEDHRAAEAVGTRAAQRMGRSMDTSDLPDLLLARTDHPRWDDIAQRCLACTNCTLVCPTCFCTSVDDVTDLAGTTVDRVRVWDSCFTTDFSFLHGGSVRTSIASRYRQWATHKLASWVDQFGTSGCVGCGRCITWCPAAIDITAEVASIRAGSE